MKRKESHTPPKKLNLKQLQDGRFMDQYGRILETYTNKEGKTDLRPVGVGYRFGDTTVPK